MRLIIKKILFLAAVSFIALSFLNSEAQSSEKKKRAVKPAQRKAVKLNPKKIKKIIEQNRTGLDGTQWDIEIKTSAGEVKSNDTLYFEDKKFSSGEFQSIGFNPVDYSLSVKDDGDIVFETMQPGLDNEILFWRGEFFGESGLLKGILSRVSGDKPAEDLYFSGRKKLDDAKESVKE